MEKNPEVIQASAADRYATPVFLIHDGGGTTFAYHCLDPLDRPVYGIFNPYFHTGEGFEGGICGMARLYAKIIRHAAADPDFPAQRDSGGRANILIGGWSLGGLLALEVAKILTGDRGVRIIGALMMDSIYPVNPPSTVRLGALDDMVAGEKSKNEVLTLQAMKEALQVIQKWTPPVWAGKQISQRPRFSLLRALDFMPATGIDGVHPADIHRSDPTLGWDSYDTSLFTDVEDVPGTHFEMFSLQHVEGLSKTVKRCLDRLDLLFRLSLSRSK